MNKLMGLILVAACTVSYAADVQVQALEEVYVVKDGYDSNDNIELTVHGQLPNACYTARSVEIDRTNNNFFVRFLIQKRELSGCEELEANFPINFTSTKSLGELKPGNYQVNFLGAEGSQKVTFNVKKAVHTQLDDELYAPISNAFIPELIYTNQIPQVILTGMFYTNCMRLKDQDIQVIQQDKMFIIIPKAEILEYAQCNQEEYPLQNIVPLPEIKEPGHYFIHVRSQSGLSVNKVFHVKERDSFPTGR